MKKITIKDIAKLANVSVSTVSRVINNDAGVAAETQDRIERIIKQENYQPSMIARGMVSQKTRMIAVIVSDITNPYFHELVAALEKKLLNSGYSLSLFDSQTALTLDAKNGVSVEVETINRIRKNHFDATIILGGLVDRISIPSPYLEALKNLVNEMPTIVIGSIAVKNLIHSENLIYLNRDQSIPIKLLINYMLRKKYQNFIFIGGNDSAWITKMRTDAFKETLVNNHIDVKNLTILNNNFYAEDGYNAAKYIIKNQIDFDAVVAINDRVASGFLRGIRDLSNREFLDFGLGSCEFFEGSRFNIPRITSVDHNIALLGSTISNSLIRSLEGLTIQPITLDVTPKLVIGETC